ncbi:MAG: hypothetical protein Q9208_008073 [Pyrenodesmia sp. 3 TL-2023]
MPAVLTKRIGLKGVFGSLTLGGFDAARFVPNNVSFNLASDISRDLVVGLQSITSTENGGSPQQLLPSPHLTFIDSTVSEIYLPIKVCQSFERVFNLVWNETYGLYLVSDDLHQRLLARNTTFTFGISNSKNGGPTVDITLPYSSFDLTYKYSFDLPALRYFPILRAMNDTQNTLGRSFLQETYLVTDYQRGNFSIFQARFEEPMSQKIVPILPPNANPTTQSTSNPTTGPTPSSTTIGAVPRASESNLGLPKIAGIVVGALSGFVLLLSLCCLPLILRYRRREKGRRTTGAMISSADDLQRAFKASQTGLSPQSPNGAFGPDCVVVPEIGRNSRSHLRELPNNYKVELPENAIQPLRTPTPLQPTQPTEIAQPTGSLSVPRSRRGLFLSNARIFSRGDYITYWMNVHGIRTSQIEGMDGQEAADHTSPKPAYLEKSLPTTPISDSPQESAFPAWTRIGAPHRDVQDPDTPPVRVEDRYQHRRGFF